MASSIKRFYATGGKGSYEEIVLDSPRWVAEIQRDTVEDEYRVVVLDKDNSRDYLFQSGILVECLCSFIDGLDDALVEDVKEPLICNMSREEAGEYVK